MGINNVSTDNMLIGLSCDYSNHPVEFLSSSYDFLTSHLFLLNLHILIFCLLFFFILISFAILYKCYASPANPVESGTNPTHDEHLARWICTDRMICSCIYTATYLAIVFPFSLRLVPLEFLCRRDKVKDLRWIPQSFENTCRTQCVNANTTLLQQ